MLISSLKIKNYRGLDINIDTIEKVSIIIGQNDSGKPNICSAIMKVLDYNKRRIPFVLTDSTNSNKEDIEIEINLTADDLTKEQLSLIGNYIHIKDDKKYIIVKLISKFNEDTLEYEDTLFYGNTEMDFEEVRINTQTQLDKVLAIVYINPVYDAEFSKKEFFKFKESDNKEKGVFFSENIINEISNLNTSIQSEQIINDIQNEINEKGEFSDLFEDLKFKVLPNIKEENIYKSLNINAYDNEDNEFNNIGDGKNKIFSMILKSKIYNDSKQKIFIIEEPENHLYVLLQKVYISALLKMNPSQLIITTHSPYTIDFEKTNQIIKIGYNPSNKSREIYNFDGIKNDDFKNFGYLINVEVAEMLYYNNVLLIEGDSEKYFYSLLMSKDNKFCKKINEKRFGIYAVNGIAFKTIKELLEKLGITVYIKTDNDIFKVPKIEEYRYAGLERCIQFLDNDGKEELKKLLNVEKLEFRFADKNSKLDIIENNIPDICKLLKKNNIIFSQHNDGFEMDFIEYIKLNKNNIVTDEAIDFLKQAKLKNLHYFIDEYNIDITTNDDNKKSVLVGFLYD